MLLLSNLAGMLGLGARAALYPGLFRECGRRPAFGRGMVIRRPAQIGLGDKVLLDDYTSLDVRGEAGAITVGDHCIISRFSTIAAKNGRITLGPGVNIGSYCRVATESLVEFGSSVLVGAFCYIGPGNHQLGTDGTPLIAMEMEKKGGVKIGDNAWLGTHVTVVDGVTIGEGAIVGAHALVRDDVPPWTVAAGVPAKVIKQIPRNG
ncbi:MAG: acyltransferase [Oligoflexia bacterium]|nr:acyltransferase [Oligoflexia bacterium]